MTKSKPFMYVHCATHREFLEVEKSHPDYQCIRIMDSFTLRGRTPGVIKITERAHEKWNHQEILESIVLHEEKWNLKQQNETDLDYGID